MPDLTDMPTFFSLSLTPYVKNKAIVHYLRVFTFHIARIGNFAFFFQFDFIDHAM